MNYRLGEFQEFSRYNSKHEAFLSDEWVNNFPQSNKKTLSKLAQQEKKHLTVKSTTISTSMNFTMAQNFRSRIARVVKGSVVASLVALFDRFA